MQYPVFFNALSVSRGEGFKSNERSSVSSSPILPEGSKATPAYIVLDSEGNEIHRAIGFLSPDDFLRQFEIAKSNVRKNQYKKTDNYRLSALYFLDYLESLCII